MNKIILKIITLCLIIFCVNGCDSEEENTLPITGRLISHTDCKDNLPSNIKSVSNNNESIIEYNYDPQSKILQIKHINAGFNCCPEGLYCEITTSGDTINIQEFENDSLCRCLCLYDLDINIENIEAAKYYFKFHEPYCGDQNKLYFEMDIENFSEGR
ncbi:hypothetical protein ACFLTI_08355, partial [Bacteroidota bacterium]